MKDYPRLLSAERSAYDKILSFLVFLDSIQTANLPNICLLYTSAQIPAPHWAVERADVLDLIQNAAGLFQQELDVGAVLAHDVGEVAAVSYTHLRALDMVGVAIVTSIRLSIS